MKTWIDPSTNLEWEAEENNLELTWDEAQDYAQTLGNEWRLPTLKELITLADYTKLDPAIVDGPKISSDDYWSSTAYADTSYSAWYVYFYDGHAYYCSKTNKSNACCVRDEKYSCRGCLFSGMSECLDYTESQRCEMFSDEVHELSEINPSVDMIEHVREEGRHINWD